MNVLSASKTLANFVKLKLESRRTNLEIAARPSEFRDVPVGGHRYRAALFFADTQVNLYQARQWYEPLRQLARSVPFVIIAKNPATAISLRDECDLPVFFAKTIGEVEALLETQQIDAVFYVNQNILNFQMIRFNRPAHIFISHGESEKSYMWSNQLKAYDYVFSAGQAARDRLEKNITRFDAAARTRLVGRPQIDVEYDSPVQMNKELPTVLYAPTWEGDRPSMTYGSVATHGPGIVGSLLAHGGFNLIFRPHPRSGFSDPVYRQALVSIKEQIAAANYVSRATYYYDTSHHWGWQWSQADICISDISAAAYDFMATGKPLVITKPVSSEARVDESPALLRLPSMSVAESSETPSRIAALLTQSDESYADLVHHYFGDTSPGASMKRFLNAAMDIIDADLRAQGTHLN